MKKFLTAEGKLEIDDPIEKRQSEEKEFTEEEKEVVIKEVIMFIIQNQ